MREDPELDNILIFLKIVYLLRPDHLPLLRGVFEVEFQMFVTQTEMNTI